MSSQAQQSIPTELRIEPTKPHVILGDFFGLVYKSEIKRKVFGNEKAFRKCIDGICDTDDKFKAMYEKIYKQKHGLPIFVVEMIMNDCSIVAAYETRTAEDRYCV
jgi:hypothetical protein